MNVRILLTPILFLLISGCSILPSFGEREKPLVIQKQAVEKTPLNLPPPTPVKLREVKFVIVTPENAEQVWNELKEKNVDLVLFGMTDNDYQNLAINIAEIRNLINSQRIMLIKYKEYYEPEKKEEKK